MKTFKLVSLQVVEEDQLLDIELIDGLIITQENEQSLWMIDAFIDKSYYDYFQKLMDTGKDLLVQVVITKKSNSPAAFQTKIVTLKLLENHVSLLLQGTLKKTNNDYAVIVLKNLIDQNLSGDDLLEEFKKIMRNKPPLTLTRNE